MNEQPKTPILEYLNLTINLRETLLQKVQNEINEVIRFIISLMGTLGIIAGFGFTAFQYIESPFLFFIGEVLVVGTILYLGFNTKNTLVELAIDTQDHVNHWVQKATEVRKALVDRNEPEINQLEKEFSENLDDSTLPKKYIGAEVVGRYLNLSMWFGAIGTFLIIASFFLCL